MSISKIVYFCSSGHTTSFGAFILLAFTEICKCRWFFIIFSNSFGLCTFDSPYSILWFGVRDFPYSYWRWEFAFFYLFPTGDFWEKQTMSFFYYLKTFSEPLFFLTGIELLFRESDNYSHNTEAHALTLSWFLSKQDKMILSWKNAYSMSWVKYIQLWSIINYGKKWFQKKNWYVRNPF